MWKTRSEVTWMIQTGIVVRMLSFSIVFHRPSCPLQGHCLQNFTSKPSELWVLNLKKLALNCFQNCCSYEREEGGSPQLEVKRKRQRRASERHNRLDKEMEENLPQLPAASCIPISDSFPEQPSQQSIVHSEVADFPSLWLNVAVRPVMLLRSGIHVGIQSLASAVAFILRATNSRPFSHTQCSLPMGNPLLQC